MLRLNYSSTHNNWPAGLWLARGRETPHMKGVGMLVGNFELKKETDLGVAPAFFDS